MDMGRRERVAGAGQTCGLDGDAGLADGLGERAHVAVVLVAAAVEHGLGDAGRLGALGQQLAGALGALGLWPASAARARTS